MVPFSPCVVCGSGSWACFGKFVLCLACSQAPRTQRLLRYRLALWRCWTLTAEGPPTNQLDCRHVIDELNTLLDEVGEPLATALRRKWEDEWWERNKTCPICGGPGRHRPDSGEGLSL